MYKFKAIKEVEVVADGYSYDDRDTTMSYDYSVGHWYIYSTVPSHITKMLKRFGDNVEVLERLKTIDGRPVKIRCIVPENAVSFRKVLSDEEQAAKSEQCRQRGKQHGFASKAVSDKA